MTNKIHVAQFEPKHLEMIQTRDPEIFGDCPKVVMNTAFTFFKDEEVVAIFGGFPFVPGVIHFWGLTSPLVEKYRLDFHKTVLKVIKWYEQTEKPRRIQIDVRADYPMGCKWAESLGFRKEALLAAWGPKGEAHYLYGRICSWQS